MLRYILLLQYVPYAVICLFLSSQKSNRFLAIIIHLKECASIHISVSIIEKVFHYKETELPLIKYKDEIWFRGKTIAEILGYAIQRKAIHEHVDPEDRMRLTELRGGRNLRTSESKQNETDPLKSKGSKTDPLKRN